MGYTEGTFDQPVDPKDRLVRIGSRFNSTVPTVDDGDNVYFNVDSSGRLRISGPAAHDAAAVANPVRIAGVYRTTLPAVASGDIVDLLAHLDGRLITRAHVGELVIKMVTAVAIVTGTPATIWTPAAGKKVRMLGWTLSASAAARLQFEDSAAAGTVIAQSALLATAGISNMEKFGEGLALAAANNLLKLNVSANSTVSGMVFGVEE